MAEVLVLAEHDGGEVKKVTVELLSAARRLSSYQPNDIEDMQSQLLPAALGNAPNAEIELSLDDYPMWGQTFRGEGYDTYLAGKWHMDEVCMQRSFEHMGPVGPGMYRSTGITGTAYHRPHPDGSRSGRSHSRNSDRPSRNGRSRSGRSADR